MISEINDSLICSGDGYGSFGQEFSTDYLSRMTLGPVHMRNLINSVLGVFYEGSRIAPFT